MITDQYNYLVIGGSTKCGTTSVFKYFEFHPQVCPCVLKESRYFLEKEYSFLKNRKARDFKNTKFFSELFPDCKPGAIRLEATPDYLYSEKAAVKIKSELPSVKFIFILRNPVERLKSWYKFAITMGLMDKNTTFDEYVNLQQKQSGNVHQHMKSLHQGLYSKYIEHFIDLFGKENVHICFYEHLVEDPLKFCESIARFAGIDENYFKDYDFKVYNKTVQVKSVGVHNLFRKFKRTIRPFTRMIPAASRKKLKSAGFILEQTYFAANKTELDSKIEVTHELNDFISSYYSNDIVRLEQITGSEIPWNNIIKT